MLQFVDTPYRFRPAKPLPILMWLCGECNRRRILPGPNHRITRVRVEGAEHLDQARVRGGKRWMFVANHSTHSDPQILTETQKQLGVSSCYMAAHDVFERGRILSWILQRTGCFSVNRDGNDGRSLREAIRILSEGRFPLSVFPEGNVYLRNDRVTPFLEGAAFLGMKAQKELGPDRPIFVIPVSIKATHVTDQRQAVYDRLQALAEDTGTEVDRAAPLPEEIKRLGMLTLERSLRQRGLMPPQPYEGDIRGHLEQCARSMIERLEEKMTLEPKPGALPAERVRQIRSHIHKVRTDPRSRADHQVAVTWADEAMTALRVLSYAGNYLDDSPSLDRCAETVEKLREDVYSETQPPMGERHALVQISPPIELALHLEKVARQARRCVAELTARFEEAIQSGLDAIATRNESPGNQPF